MSLLGFAADSLRAAARMAEKIEGGHGPWCEDSKGWAPSVPGGVVLPMRISQDVIEKMWSDDGWEFPSKAVSLVHVGDGTLSLHFSAAEEVDQISNRVVQQMMMTALDLSAALDSTSCELSAEAIEALSAFKKAARQRLHA